jgi:multidrug efflux pump subunit AcrA (membrane-fusion protein)
MTNLIAKLTGGASKKVVIIVAAGVLAAVVLGLIVRSRSVADTKQAKATFRVVRGNLDIVLHDTGDLQAKDSIKIQPEAEGEQTIVQLAEEGSLVKKGDFLVKFDATQLEKQISDSEIDLENSMANLLRAQEQKKIQELTNETNLARAKLGLESARMETEKYGIVNLTPSGFLDTDSYLVTETRLEFPLPGVPDGILTSDSWLEIPPPMKGEAYQSFRDSELGIERAKTELDRAESDFSNMDQLLAKGFVTKNEYISGELKVLEARRNLESAQLKHLMFRLYTYPKTLSERRTSLKQAEDGLKQTEIQIRSDMTQKDAAIKESQAVYDMKKTNLAKLKDKLTKMTITAPDPGLVIYGDQGRPWEKERIKVGGKVWKGMVIVTIPKVSNMVANTKVMERNVNKVKAGQNAVITLPALPGVKLAGKVSKVSSVASAAGRWWSPSDVKTFDVEVTLEESDPRMKPGMSCEVDMLVNTLKDIVYVPVNSVFREGDSDVCYVVSQFRISPANVTLGEGGELYVEIKEGIKEGQEVLLYSAATPGQTQAQAGKKGSGKKPGNGAAKPFEGKAAESTTSSLGSTASSLGSTASALGSTDSAVGSTDGALSSTGSALAATDSTLKQPAGAPGGSAR